MSSTTSHTAFRFLRQLKYSPSPPPPPPAAASASAPAPSIGHSNALHSFSCRSSAYLGARQLRIQPPRLIQDGSSFTPLAAAPLGIVSSSAASRVSPCFRHHLVSYYLLSCRSFSSAEAANFVAVSTEECAQEAVETTPTEGTAAVSSDDGIAVAAQSSVSQDDSNAAVQQQMHSPAEQPDVAGEENGSHEFRSSVKRLEKIIEDQRQSLDHVRARLKDQKEIINSILKDISVLKSQSEKGFKEGVNVKPSSAEPERSLSQKHKGQTPILDEVEIVKKDQGEHKTKLGKDKRGETPRTPGKIQVEGEADADAQARAVAQSENWKCPRCSFTNLQHKNRCVECSLKRPQSTEFVTNLDHETTQKLSVMSSVDEEAKSSRTAALKVRVDERQARKEKALSSDDELADEDGSDELSDESDVDDIFDDISGSEDSSASEKDTSRKSSLSDLVKDNKKAFSPRKGQDQRGPDRKDDSRKKVKAKGYGDEDSSKPKRATQTDDEDDDIFYDELPRRDGRRNDFRERGTRVYGRGRGGRGYRGDSYDDDSYSRRSDGAWRESRSYGGRNNAEDGGWKERGSRGRGGGRGFARGRGRSRY